MKNTFLRLGEIAKDGYLFIQVLAGKLTLDEAENILAKREHHNKQLEAEHGSKIF